ncbi:hypothetical protein B0H14DRAFT_2607120 [Mycena olivaceomarginata]|nr:hypothetical protein B0H14DRAFT_2607120 [Mycena olivaceomarginata]
MPEEVQEDGGKGSHGLVASRMARRRGKTSGREDVGVEAKRCNNCHIGKFGSGNLRPALTSNSEEAELLKTTIQTRGGPNYHAHTKKALKTNIFGRYWKSEGSTETFEIVDRSGIEGPGGGEETGIEYRAAGNERAWGGDQACGRRAVGKEHAGGSHRARMQRVSWAWVQARAAGNEHEGDAYAGIKHRACRRRIRSAREAAIERVWNGYRVRIVGAGGAGGRRTGGD